MATTVKIIVLMVIYVYQIKNTINEIANVRLLAQVIYTKYYFGYFIVRY